LCEFIEQAPPGFVRPGATLAERYGLDVGQAAGLESQFDRLALDLFAFQVRHVAVYRAYVAAQRPHVEPRRACDVPALPLEAFKIARVASFPEPQGRIEFRTSGTTATGY